MCWLTQTAVRACSSSFLSAVFQTDLMTNSSENVFFCEEQVISLLTLLAFFFSIEEQYSLN